MGTDVEIIAGCSKRLSSKAAASEDRRHSGFHPPAPELSEQPFSRVGYDLNDGRTKLGERRVSARRGWAGEKIDFFSILLPFAQLHR
jgi:hypothetical protein